MHPIMRVVASPGLVPWRSSLAGAAPAAAQSRPASSSSSAPSPAARSWSGYRPGTNWVRGPGRALAGASRCRARRPRPPGRRACMPTQMPSRSGWAGYAPSSAWTRLSPGCRLAGLFAGRGAADQHEAGPRPRAEPLCRRTGAKLPRIRHRPAGAAGQALAARLAVSSCCDKYERRQADRFIEHEKHEKHERGRARRIGPSGPPIRFRVFRVFRVQSTRPSGPIRLRGSLTVEPEGPAGLASSQASIERCTRPFSSNRPTAGVASGRIAIAARSVPASS